MSAKAYEALAHNARSGKSQSLFGDIDGTWTRAQTIDAVESIAGRLDAVLGGRGPDALVAIHLPRDRRYLATIFAAWACGSAFVPLNPLWPDPYRQRVLDIARPHVVVCADGDPDLGRHARLALPPTEAIASLALPDAAQRERWQALRTHSRLSYAIFTSGSTGDPKGVLISSRAYDAYRAWTARYWPEGGSRRVLLVTAELTFDITLGDLAFALAHDVEVHVSPSPSNVFAHAKLIRDRQVDVLYSVPTTLARLFPLARAREDVRLDGLALVIAGGDSFAPGLIDLVKDAAPRAAFHNVYGPTEVTINCVATRVDTQRERIAAAGLVPIGLPFDHLRVRLAGEEPGERDGWTQGELLVSGAQCMEGYLSDEPATRRAFVEHAGHPYYRTGDLVQRDPDGYLYVAGRKDSLAKVKGYRVNPVTVDNLLAAQPGVAQARTIFVRAPDGEGSLVSFVVARPPIAAASLLQACRDALPAYCVPARIVAVDAIPIGASGKFDERRLLEILAR